MSPLAAVLLFASTAWADDVPAPKSLPLPPPLDLGSPRDKAEAPRNIAAAAVAVAAHIERFKQYPADARGAIGTVLVKFRLDESGRLLESSIATPTCSDALNKGALAAIRRAAPFPPGPHNEDGYEVAMVFRAIGDRPPMSADCHPPVDNVRQLERTLGLHPPS